MVAFASHTSGQVGNPTVHNKMPVFLFRSLPQAHVKRQNQRCTCFSSLSTFAILKLQGQQGPSFQSGQKILQDLVSVGEIWGGPCKSDLLGSCLCSFKDGGWVFFEK